MKKIISLILIFALLCPAVSADIKTDVLSSATVTEYKSNSSEFGVWSFFATAGFYPVKDITASGYPTDDGNLQGSGIMYADYKYGDVSDKDYYIPVTARWLDSAESNGIKHNGLYFGYDGGYQRSMMLINPNVSDGRVRFYLNGPHNTYYKKAGDMGVCFTAPKDGIYKIHHDFINKGTGIENYGNGIVRRSIMKDGAVIETAENTLDFEFGAFSSGSAAPSVETVTEELSAGDRVYIRVSSVKDSYNDDFYGKIIISELDTDGNVITEYDLSKLAFSTVGNWSFYNAQVSVTDADEYHHMFAYSKSDTEVAAYSSGADDKSYKSVNKTPSFEWTKGEKILVTGGTRVTGSIINNAQAILSWTAPEDGAYRLDIVAQNHEDNATEGSVINISRLNALEKEDTNIIKTITLPASTESIEESVGGEFKKGDRIMIRFTRNDSQRNAKFYIKPQVISLDPQFKAEYSVGDNKITSSSELLSGDTLKISLNGDNNNGEDKMIEFLTCVYSDGKLVIAKATPIDTIKAWHTKKAELEVTLPEEISNLQIVTYVWSDFNKAVPLCNEMILK